mgnify:CR=1 FL=1
MSGRSTIDSVSKDDAIVVKGLRKSFKDLKVLRGVDFSVPRGQVLALLGPNGAGKTTTVRILSTLLSADGGSARVNGHDVASDKDGVKQSIGLTGQFAAVDEYLTGEENIQLIGRLYRLSKADTKRRTAELLKQFDLVKASKRKVSTYSGGMRRRLDLAMSLVAAPPIIFLDEPTTGLDPRSRLALWHMIEQLVAGGTTILLTTQYMEEADHLADQVVVIDHGKVIAKGTPDQLKSKVGSSRVEVIINKDDDFAKAKKAIGGRVTADPENRLISVATKDGVKTLRSVLGALEKAKVDVESVSLKDPTLDDVFLKLTGHKAAAKSNGKNKKEKVEA